MLRYLGKVARRLPLDRHSGANRGYVLYQTDFGICCSHWLIILFSIVLVSYEDLQFDILEKSVTCHWQSLRASTFELAFQHCFPDWSRNIIRCDRSVLQYLMNPDYFPPYALFQTGKYTSWFLRRTWKIDLSLLRLAIFSDALTRTLGFVNHKTI